MGFAADIRRIQSEELTAAGIMTIQVNLGYRCNMTCTHCHVTAGPGRLENMTRENIYHLLSVIKKHPAMILDITGGAPELNPHFRFLVAEARRSGCQVIVRTNLTVFFEEGMEGLPEFFSDNGVELIASLPYCLENEVNRVRGEGAFQKSIEALIVLNRVGYGNGLILSVIYNPRNLHLPTEQKELEKVFKKVLLERYGIVFDRLYALTNMPLGRFRDSLKRSGNLGPYMELLISSFNPGTLAGLMCRHGISVGWDGRLYDCDFNQAAGLAIHRDYPRHIKDFKLSLLSNRKIVTGEHCYGCTAASGST